MADARAGGPIIYTYELPYPQRMQFCDLLDSDRSWERLGGEYLGLTTVQLGLIGHAILRKASPTEELLEKCELSNLRISDLYQHLASMNHKRAMSLLEPYLCFGDKRNQLHQMDESNATSANNNKQVQLTDAAPHTDANRDAQLNDADGAILNNNKCHRQLVEHKDRDRADAQNGDVKHKQVKTTEGQPMQQLDKDKLKHHRSSLTDPNAINQLRLIMQIKYKELRDATDNFAEANILGNGGFASVYRGHWKGTDVAIKRLKCNLMDQALNELTILNGYRIDNLLPIYGISVDGPEACLVYQFMVNGSLEDRLSCKHNTCPLNWTQRASIAEGVAKGLFYLHNLRSKPIVHGDIKSANILLDAQYNPKLGDFGLSRQLFSDVVGSTSTLKNYTHCTVSSIHGTSVYLPSEYLRHKILSPAVDVYSYGIVLLEMATGRRAFNGKRHLIDIIEEEMKSMPPNQISYRLKDHRLENDTQTDIKIWYELLIKLGLACAHKLKNKRPPMAKVLEHFNRFKAREKANLSSFVDSATSPVDSARGNSLNDRHYIAGAHSPFTPPITGGRQELPTTRARSFVPTGQYQCQQQQQHQQQQHPIIGATTSSGMACGVMAPMDIDPEPQNLINMHQEASIKPVNGIQTIAADAMDEPGVDPIIPLVTELGAQNS